MNTSTTISITELLESGAHFGHQRNRWNPKMKRYIFEERNGIYIIDLAKTLHQIHKGAELIRSIIGKRKSVLFVGTKKQAKLAVRESAESCNEFYVSERWLGGMLTNLTTIRQSVKTLEKVEKMIAEGAEHFTKKEIGLMTKEQNKLEKNLSGIRAMRKPPGLLILVDSGREHIAVAEANKMGIPVLAIVDTNCDPDPIDCVIPCNDDSLKSIKLILNLFTNVIQEKKHQLEEQSNPHKEIQDLSHIHEDEEIAGEDRSNTGVIE